MLQAKLRNVFHVVLLKTFNGTPTMVTPPLPPIVRGRDVPNPERMVRARPTAASWDLLVQW
jgi:hypothetical protein